MFLFDLSCKEICEIKIICSLDTVGFAEWGDLRIGVLLPPARSLVFLTRSIAPVQQEVGLSQVPAALACKSSLMATR